MTSAATVSPASARTDGLSVALIGRPVSAQRIAYRVAALPARVLGSCRAGIGVSAARPDGLLLWHAYGFAPRSALAVAIDGPSHYAFAVTTDRYGVYTGTLGGRCRSGHTPFA